MSRDQPPPSKMEREALVMQRKNDLSKPIPMPRPKGPIGSAVDAATAQRRRANAHIREQRINSIEEALNAKKNMAKSSFSRVKNAGLAKAHAQKFKVKSSPTLSR